MNWKLIGVICCISLLTASVPQSQAGFHEGEELDCNGCHGFTTPDPSSRCLHCHAQQYRVLSQTGDAYTPAGDFFWLTKHYISGDYFSSGNTHGHNIVAGSHGLGPDPALFAAPGDGAVDYEAEWLACTSCHDPHMSRSDSGATYRLLGTKGYNGGGKAEDISFEYQAPVAEPSSAMADDWLAENDQNHPDYIAGMSEWCTNCHSGYITRKGMSHPSGRQAVLREIAKTYNCYTTGGNNATGEEASFDFLVPIERGDMDAESSQIFKNMATTTSSVMCLSCHRAHASAFQAIGRWDLKVDLLANSPVLNTPEGIHAYYGQSIVERYGKREKGLCFKCHNKH